MAKLILKALCKKCMGVVVMDVDYTYDGEELREFLERGLLVGLEKPGADKTAPVWCGLHNDCQECK